MTPRAVTQARLLLPPGSAVRSQARGQLVVQQQHVFTLGADGLLNGASQTPMTALPRENVGMIAASRSASATE
jgi:hypothetical protein